MSIARIFKEIEREAAGGAFDAEGFKIPPRQFTLDLRLIDGSEMVDLKLKEILLSHNCIAVEMVVATGTVKVYIACDKIILVIPKWL